jgi:hypothetical protein
MQRQRVEASSPLVEIFQATGYTLPSSSGLATSPRQVAGQNLHRNEVERSATMDCIRLPYNRNAFTHIGLPRGTTLAAGMSLPSDGLMCITTRLSLF